MLTDRPKLLVPWWMQIPLTLLIVVGIWFFIAAVPMDEKMLENGNQYVAVGQPDLALKSYQRGLDYNPDNVEIQFQQALIMAQLGQPTEALDMLNSISNYPKPALIAIQKGWILYYQGDMNASNQQFVQAFKIGQENSEQYTPFEWSDIYAGLGWSTYLTEGCEVATEYFVQALDITPDMAIAQRGLDNCQ